MRDEADRVDWETPRGECVNVYLVEKATLVADSEREQSDQTKVSRRNFVAKSRYFVSHSFVLTGRVMEHFASLSQRVGPLVDNKKVESSTLCETRFRCFHSLFSPQMR